MCGPIPNLSLARCFPLILTILLALVLLSILWLPNVVHHRRAAVVGVPNQIVLDKRSVPTEGIGAVLSNLKPVLLLAQNTNAIVTSSLPLESGHGYSLRTYLRFLKPLPKSLTKLCNLTRSLDDILLEVAQQCQHFNFTVLASYGVFDNCNTVISSQYLSHPRGCIKHTEDVVRRFTKFELVEKPKNDICVMRRGGDVESRILKGDGNMWAIDEKRTFPLLANLSKSRTVVVITETNQADIREKYFADVFSNRESLPTVVAHLSGCRCMFVAGSSSFAASMVQITQPEYIIYTESRPGFEYKIAPYNFSEYGENAVPLRVAPRKIIELCGRQTATGPNDRKDSDSQ